MSKAVVAALWFLVQGPLQMLLIVGVEELGEDRAVLGPALLAWAGDGCTVFEVGLASV